MSAPNSAGNRANSERPSQFTIARFSLTGPLNPSVTDTLPLAEAVRSTLMAIYQRRLHLQKHGTADKPYQERFFSQTFSGKDAAGRPLRGHAHAYYLPADEDGDGRLDHLTIVAEQGFTSEEVGVLDRLRQVWLGEDTPLRLLLVGLGSEGDFRSLLFAKAATWVSATPFLATRYPKLRGGKRDRPEHYATPREFAAHVLSQELERLRQRRPGLPRILAIEPLEGLGRLTRFRPIQFQRFRHKRGDDGGRRPTGAFRLVFESPVSGPLCLGHSCHFGLGLFVPEAGGTINQS